MTEEIKQLIEEESIEYAQIISERISLTNRVNSSDFALAVKHGANLILSKWQEADRWRKFTTDDLPNLGMRILLKNGNRRDTTVVHSHQHIHELAECFTEWKPIS